MREQRKATAAGDQNTVTHEAAEPKTGPETSSAAARVKKSDRVTLCVKFPHVKLDLSPQDLPVITEEGTTVTAAEADAVLTWAMKLKVPVFVVEDDDTDKEN
jgi:hypothetical protein